MVSELILLNAFKRFFTIIMRVTTRIMLNRILFSREFLTLVNFVSLIIAIRKKLIKGKINPFKA